MTFTFEYFEILGISQDASMSEIKAAYRRLAMKWHPDKHMNSPQEERDYAERMFKLVNEAYHAVISWKNGDQHCYEEQADDAEGCQYNQYEYSDTSDSKNQSHAHSHESAHDSSQKSGSRKETEHVNWEINISEGVLLSVVSVVSKVIGFLIGFLLFFGVIALFIWLICQAAVLLFHIILPLLLVALAAVIAVWLFSHI